MSTVKELRNEARTLGISGRSSMNKGELEAAIQAVKSKGTYEYCATLKANMDSASLFKVMCFVFGFVFGFIVTIAVAKKYMLVAVLLVVGYGCVLFTLFKGQDAFIAADAKLGAFLETFAQQFSKLIIKPAYAVMKSAFSKAFPIKEEVVVEEEVAEEVPA